MDYENYWKDSIPAIAQNLLRCCDLNNMAILTHSNSNTVISVFRELTKKGLVFKVFQTRSIPGDEGVISQRNMESLGIKVSLTDDEKVSEIIHKTDIVVVGCDAMLDDKFLNKVGTLRIAQLSEEHRKPFMIITESRKKIENQNWKKQVKRNPLFEWVPLYYAKDVITEKAS